MACYRDSFIFLYVPMEIVQTSSSELGRGGDLCHERNPILNVNFSEVIICNCI
jgi:hypothetical protein